MGYPLVDVTPHPQSFAYATNRPRVGAVVHNTVTANVAQTRQFAGWHWQIGRDGTRYDTVSEENVAFHVAATDRWRPPWLVTSPGGFSDANWCSVSVELVSLAGGAEPAGYERYTSDQYASARELFAEWRRKYGDIPFVGHGELQADRSDPVGLDWEQAGCGPLVPNWGRHFVGNDPPPSNGGVPPVETHLYTDEELDQLLAELFAGGGDYNPALAIDRSWRDEYRAGRYRGRPEDGEQPFHDGARRVFEFGVCVYRNGTTSWVG